MTNFVIMSDADGRVIWANAAFERKSGYALAEMAGSPLAEFTRASRSDRVVQAEIARAMAARCPFSGELLNVTRSGDEYWVDLNIAFQSSDMPDEGIFVSVATDITDQKRSQQLLARHVEEERRTSEQLRRAVRHTETILDSVEDAIISVDRGGAILSANKATERMFGTPTWELQGHRVESLLKRDDGVALSGVFQGPATVAEGLAGRAHLFDAVRKDGTSFPVELTVSEIEASDAGGAFFIVVIRDISERKRVERMQSDFLANVSHELRTPLTSVRGTLSLLQGGVLGDIHDQGQKMISAAIRNAQMLESLVDDMLDLEKLTQGKLDITCTEECLERLIRDAVSLNTSYAAGRSVALAIDEPLPRAKVTVDASRAIQILTNYLSNAVKYSEIGGTVGVRAAIRGSFARVSVVDTGCGIPDDKQGILFQKFAMADTSDVRKMRGTGLGLAIARDLATRMQGRVGLVSKVGVGSEFWVDFPIAEEVIGPP
jgi:PAS domain S-box-containing protein